MYRGFIGEERDVHGRACFFSFRASVELEKGFRSERRSAFTTKIDVYQFQRTTSNLGYFSRKQRERQ